MGSRKKNIELNQSDLNQKFCSLKKFYHEFNFFNFIKN